MARPDQKVTTVSTGRDSGSPPGAVNQRSAQNAVVTCDSGDVDRTRLTSCFHPNTTQSVGGYTAPLPLASPVHDRLQFESTRQPARSNFRGLIPVSKRLPCPICGRSQRGGCKVNADHDLVLCISQGSALRKKEQVHGADGHAWQFRGMDGRQSTWGIFTTPDRSDGPVRTLQTSRRLSQPVTRLTAQQRHTAFTLLLQKLALKTAHAADLTRRRFTAAQIAQMQAKSITTRQTFNPCPMGLPGFKAGIYWGRSGYLVPILNWDGQIVGGQVRGDDGHAWLSDCHLPNGELPLQILRGDPSKPVYWAEGTGAKPWMVHFQTGATVIGAAGGNFASCPLQVAEILQYTAGQEQVLLPDAGSIYNPNVLRQYERLAELVPNLLVRWWDQFHYGPADCDETDRWQNGTDIPSTTFFSDLPRLQAEGLTFHFSRQPDLQLSQRFLPRDLLTSHVSPLDVVISGLGTGKTEALKAVVDAADQPVVVISRNRKTVRHICQRIGVPYVEEGRSDFTDDRDLNITWMRQKGFGTCSASIRRDSALRFNPADFNGCIVVLDEWDATASDIVLNQQTDIAKHRMKVMQSLSLLVETASRVIALSGTMRQVDVTLLEQLTQQQAFVIHNDHQAAAGRSLTCFTREALLRAQLFSHLQNRGTALVHTSDQERSKWAAQNLHASALKMVPTLSDADSDFFDGDSTSCGSHRQKQLPADPDAVLKELKSAYVSPVLAAGVSITLQNHFDQVTIYSGGHLSVADVVQTGARLRTDAPRFMYVPEGASTTTFGGATDPKAIAQSVHHDCRRLDDLLQLSRVAGTVLDADPWFVYACQVYALQNLQSRHYRHLILKAYQREGYAVTVLNREPTQQEKQQNERQKAFVDDANLRKDLKVAAAPMPSADLSDIPPADRQNSQRKARLVKLFGIDPDSLTAQHVADADKAHRALRNRFFLHDATAHQIHTAQQLEERSGGDLSSLFPMDKARIGQKLLALTWLQQLLKAADAEDLFSRSNWFDHRDPMVQRIHRAVLEDDRAQRFIGSRHTSFKCAIGTVQAVLQVVGFRTESRQARVDGRVVRQHRIVDQFHHFDPSRIIRLWKTQPELLLDLEEPSADAGVTDYPI